MGSPLFESNVTKAASPSMERKQNQGSGLPNTMSHLPLPCGIENPFPLSLYSSLLNDVTTGRAVVSKVDFEDTGIYADIFLSI